MVEGAAVIVMPAQNSGWYAGYLHGRYNGLGWLQTATIDARREIDRVWPWAVDNGIYAAFAAGRRWDYRAFRSGVRQLVQRGRQVHHLPRWIAVPDSVGNRERTLRRWQAWYPVLAPLDVPLAFVVQDGMTPGDVPAAAAVVFIGGSTAWKERTLGMWCREFPRVHVGRVNGYRMLRACADAGAESCDGSGWFRGDKQQLAGLERFLSEQASGERWQSSLLELAYEQR